MKEHPGRVALRRLRTASAVSILEPPSVEVLGPAAVETVCALAEERLAQLERPAERPNGALFFTELEGELVHAHDTQAVNENALLDLLRGLNRGEPLTLEELAGVFGIDAIHALIKPAIGEDRRARRDVYRAAVLSGIAASSFLDGRLADVELVDRTENVLRLLSERGVL